MELFIFLCFEIVFQSHIGKVYTRNINKTIQIHKIAILLTSRVHVIQTAYDDDVVK